eukprot:53525-Eustigmatos_ZCMA.PRE.1
MMRERSAVPRAVHDGPAEIESWCSKAWDLRGHTATWQNRVTSHAYRVIPQAYRVALQTYRVTSHIVLPCRRRHVPSKKARTRIPYLQADGLLEVLEHTINFRSTHDHIQGHGLTADQHITAFRPTDSLQINTSRHSGPRTHSLKINTSPHPAHGLTQSRAQQQLITSTFSHVVPAKDAEGPEAAEPQWRFLRRRHIC